jgi:hypothetical protein
MTGMIQPPPTISAAIIYCMVEGRTPSCSELMGVAERIWTDMKGTRSAFAWGDPANDPSDRLIILRAAQAALTGNT